MSAEQHPDPIAEGFAHGGQRLVQIVALATAVQQGYARRMEQLRAAQDARQTAAERATEQDLKASFEQARSRWAQAHDRQWLREANLQLVAEAWGAAVPHAADSASAASAARKCEERLRDLHPHAMSHYDRLRNDGQDPLSAMKNAAPFFTRDPNVRTGDPATPRAELHEGTGARWTAPAHSQGRDEWAEALQELRARDIADDLSDKLRTEGGEAHAGELHTALTVTTNLPEHLITKVADRTDPPRQAPSPEAEVAADDFPFPISEAMRMTANQAPEEPVAKRPPTHTPDRNRRRNR